MKNGKRYHAGVNPKTGKAIQNVELDLAVDSKPGALYVLAIAACRAIFKLAYPTKVEGQQYIPRTGGVVLAYTHAGGQDAITSYCTCKRRAYSLAKVQLFRNPFMKYFFRHFGCIPVDRAIRNSKSLTEAEKVLLNGNALIVFPEGTVNKKPELLPIKFGAVSLAHKAGVPIVPTIITGRYKLFRRNVRIEYTEPMRPGKNLAKANQGLTDRLQSVRNLHIEESQLRFRQSDGACQIFLKPALLGLIRFVYRPKIVGRKNIPKKGAVILASNHKHHFDPLLVMAGRPSRRVHYIAKKEHSEKIYGRIMNAFGVMFVDRERKEKTLLKRNSLKFLAKNRILAIFPEGTRNKTDRLILPFKFGAVSFAQKSGATIVPTAIVGWYRPFKKGLKVVYGEPFNVKPNEDLAKANDKLHQSIKKLLIEYGDEKHRAEIYKYYKERNKK